MKIELTDFVKRQWKSEFSGTKMNNVDKDVFINTINRIENFSIWNNSQFDFCKYLFINNENNAFDVNLGVIKLDHSIYQYIQSGYFSRTLDELPVLSRWVKFPHMSYNIPKSKYIGLVLYSKEQLLKEHISSNNTTSFELSDECKYGIVSIMGLSTQEMEPMLPITHLRNALDLKYCGNGESINIDEYNKSVLFWDKHILIK